ncbi:MAG: hypothetical protein R3Y22_08560 [Bacteroidales bacterium]
MIKRLTIVLLALLPLLSLSSCSEKTYQSAYQYQITYWHSDSDDSLTEYATVKAFYTAQGLTLDTTFYSSGDSYDANDALAIEEFQSAMLYISDTQIEDLDLSVGVVYTLGLVSAYSTDGAEPLESFTYTQY